MQEGDGTREEQKRETTKQATTGISKKYHENKYNFYWFSISPSFWYDVPYTEKLEGKEKNLKQINTVTEWDSNFSKTEHFQLFLIGRFAT